MESKRVTCPHCDFLFYPEEGVSLDDCPVCGRTVEVKPDHIADANKKAQPAPALPGDDGEICARLLSACTGHPHALIPWPHRLLHDAVSHISDLTRRLAEAEAAYKHVKDCLHISQGRAQRAEERIQELEGMQND